MARAMTPGLLQQLESNPFYANAIAPSTSPTIPSPSAPNQNGRRLVMMAMVESAMPISTSVAAPVSQ